MQKPKGTKDIFGVKMSVHNEILSTLSSIASIYNFEHIQTPIFEHAETFIQSVGQTSDIVTKEMFEFQDKKNRSLVLRPEGTAGVIRAIVENKLYARNHKTKLWYEGPMFRYENPQKGRQRQFSQFGVEYLSDPNPLVDAEVILMARDILEEFEIDYVLKINSLGDKETRDRYSESLKKYFEPFVDQLTLESQKRLQTNPLRILDDKIDGSKTFVLSAPKISEFYSERVTSYFDALQNFLNLAGVEFEIDHNLVRGLDYYTDTAFEFLSTNVESSQNTLIGGGRYSGLVKKFGGPDLSGVGFGLGIERLANEVSSLEYFHEEYNEIDVFVINLTDKTQVAAATILNLCRTATLSTEWNETPTKIQKALAKADVYDPTFIIIVGEKELSSNSVTIKFNDNQYVVAIENIVDFIFQNIQLEIDDEEEDESENRPFEGYNRIN